MNKTKQKKAFRLKTSQMQLHSVCWFVCLCVYCCFLFAQSSNKTHAKQKKKYRTENKGTRALHTFTIRMAILILLLWQHKILYRSRFSFAVDHLQKQIVNKVFNKSWFLFFSFIFFLLDFSFIHNGRFFLFGLN